MPEHKAREIADLSKTVAVLQGTADVLADGVKVTSIRPHVRVPLEDAYAELATAARALRNVGYALAHAYLMEQEGS